MTEIEYVVANFAERFAAFQGKRIVLHGSRNYAEAIITNFADRFHFVGIMSLDPITEEYFYGLKVLQESDISVLKIDLIILTERVKYAVEAFYAVRRMCRKNRIALYNMYGLDEFDVHRQADNVSSLTLTEAIKMCDSYDIIAFGVINTIFFSPQGISNISARKLFLDLIKHLHNQRKEIRFYLQKSYPAEIQIEELREFGFLQDELKEIVRKEGEDHSFRELKDANPGKKILFIGSSLAYDFILPRCYGIDSFRFIEAYNPANLVLRQRKSKTQNAAFSNVASKDKIKMLLLQKELISFDIFDTLLLRKTLYPQDVFYIMEQKAVLAGYHNVEGFASSRERVREKQFLCDIDQIYNWLGNYFDWDDEMVHKMQKLEIETEQEVLIPRKEIIDLFIFAKEMGKHVVLTCDTYFPEKVLKEFLLQFGIFGYDKLLVSCDLKKDKHTDISNELLRLSDDPKKILHIGDKALSNGTDGEEIGTVLIPSVLELAKNRGWNNSIRKAGSLMERCLLGLIISKLFRNPFQSPNLMECSVENRVRRFGESVIGAIVIGHLTWFIKKLQENHFAGVLFLARDGWLAYNIYQKIYEQFNLPKPVYYYANRHAAFLGCSDSVSESEKVADMAQSWGVDVTETLRKVFMVSQEKALFRKKGESTIDYIKRHRSLISQNAENVRNGYLRYSEKCGMLQDRSYAIYDFLSVGRTQHFLSQWLPFRFKGFYFWNYSPASPLDKEIEYYLQKKNSLLLQSYIERLEPFFTSLEPSQSSMTEDGEPVFANDYRSEQELLEVKIVLESAETIAGEFFTEFYFTGQLISPSLIEEIYAAEEFCLSQYSICDDWIGVPLSVGSTMKGFL